MRQLSPTCQLWGKRPVAYNVQQQRRAYSGKNLHIVTPSRWLERLVASSQLLGSTASTIQTIRNGLDLSIFRPQDVQASRQRLGLPPDKIIVGFGAASLNNERKGFADLQQALARIGETSNVLGLGFGDQTLETIDGMPPVTTVGYITDAETQADVYSAMDIFVLPSWAENMPQTAVEAMACGTPVVAYEVGGIPEIVHHKETGRLAKLRDIDDLAYQINALILQPHDRHRLSENARSLIESEFEIQQCTAQYTALYRSALDSRMRSAA